MKPAPQIDRFYRPARPRRSGLARLAKRMRNRAVRRFPVDSDLKLLANRYSGWLS